MKVLLLILLALFISCATTNKKTVNASKQIDPKIQWTVTQDIKNPESVYYDKESGFIFVSNINGEGTDKDEKGHITLLNKKGHVIKSKWVRKLSAPKGMRAFKGVLWVSDIDRVHSIDIKKARIIKTYKVAGAEFLNDVAISPSGDVYISDTITSKIHKISKGKLSTFISGKHLDSPNGLLFDGEKLYVASWGLTTNWNTKILGRLYTINLKTKKITYITKNPLGNLDGLEKDNQGNFLISDWVKGIIYKVSPKGQVTLIYTALNGSADIGYIKETNEIIIPFMLNNKVQSIKF